MMSDRIHHGTTIGSSPSKKTISRNAGLGARTEEGLMLPNKQRKSQKKINKSKVIIKLNSYRKKKK